jgi:putative membrane protein
MKTISPDLKQFLQRWVINTVAVMVAANVVHGIEYQGLASLLIASLLLGIFNVLLRPLLLLLSLPLVKAFRVEDFGAALWGALIISVVSLVLNALTGTGNTRVEFSRAKTQRPPDQDGGGPVIDV